METYAENPSIAQAMINTKKGFKPIFSKDSQTNISIYEENEEDLKSITLDFTTKRVVDKDQFIKIYIHSLPALSDLKNSTKILFQYILMSLSEEVGKDRLYLSYGSYVEFVEKYPLLTKVSRATYFNCLNELIEKKILFKSTLTNIFFINIAYVFNGDRLRFITEYQLKKEKSLVDDLEDDEE
ncbi:hypothetical protein DM44_2677 [Burkholderia cepacia]|uniref:hypothetical protein n=1 Tax=Burkholderiaceae TaxID=119060 RepID=UPI0004F683EA|nr:MULTISPECIES: hypothetical protein [Burkholderiaceae]AIO49463.1 hypothetical protein DM42_2879 [Burkholderia cepacia]KGB94986.1 hypothetical protein DM44_2677 [Burkholderia cepacia]MBU9282665.1 hypothetical protein [Burkholderia multivorans]MCA8183952.1 hypothetical protein [Burkholderia vietnamiensis]MDN7663992.1 hypothetical protein [Burkholderia cenocepacia]